MIIKVAMISEENPEKRRKCEKKKKNSTELPLQESTYFSMSENSLSLYVFWFL